LLIEEWDNSLYLRDLDPLTRRFEIRIPSDNGLSDHLNFAVCVEVISG
jgi:hypothetical protein